jgi:hypothetical protein
VLEPGTDIGAYRIDGLLGRGGMGVVYEATQHSLGRKVALKLLPAELSLDESFRNRFRREGRIQAGLDHAHIVPIYEAGELGDHGLFIAMRLVRGATLKELIKRGELDAARALRVLRPVADALDTAHEADLVHRDIKPQNILVGRRDHAYLADFGLTRAPGDTAFTKTGHFVGTLDYIAPEQIRGDAPGPASDRYSFAAVAYECLTGTVPFPKPTEAAVLFAHMSDPPPRPSHVRPALPAAVDDVLAAGMAKLPGERPRTVLEFMDALEDALGPAAAAGPAAPPAPPADLYTAPTPSLVEAADASTALPARTTLPVEPAATTEVQPAAAAAPVLEPQEAVMETGAGEITEVHERSGAATRPDRRRDWSPGPPQEIARPAADEVTLPAEYELGQAEEEVGQAEDERGPGDEVAPAAVAVVPADEVVPAAVAVPADEAVPAAEAVVPADEVVPAADEVVAAGVAHRTRVATRRRRAVAPLAGAAALLVVAVIAGAVAGGSGSGEAPAPVAPRQAVSFEAGPLGFRGPRGWSPRGVPELPRLELRSAAAVGRGDGTMVAGLTNAGGPTLLPAAFSDARPDDAVAIGAAQGYRFAGVDIEGADGEATLLAAPTTAGIATIACLGSEDDRRRCEAAAGSLALGDGVRAFRLGPSERYARELKSVIGRLASRRQAGLRRVSAAGTPKGQAGAASEIASAYRKAATGLGHVEPNPPERGAHAALRRAVARAGHDYAAVSAAARKEQRSRYGKAAKRARAADRTVNGALARLRALGYRVR